ncbi:radical SAM protein [Streptomyces sp. NPDC086091]|uniref:radical SAM protein n=1 Tax=Streptomyces sp. NPDC086091 TaxID=3365751 RepID=UPI003816F168
MTAYAEVPTVSSTSAPGLVWLDLTRKCQLACHHCRNESGPDGAHGSMTAPDWTRVLDEAAAAGVARVQFTGGEVTLHPDAPALVTHALKLGLADEVYSNLVHLDETWWNLFRQDNVSLATSYYGHEDAHNTMTRRNSHARTRANIAKAVSERIPIRVSVIVPDPSDTGEVARQDLAALGVRTLRVDHVRPAGRHPRRPRDRTGQRRHPGPPHPWRLPQLRAQQPLWPRQRQQPILRPRHRRRMLTGIPRK